MIATFMGTSSALYRKPEIVLNLKYLGGKRLQNLASWFEMALRASSP
jgi:hypothetical protein